MTTLVIAGVSLEVCASFAAISARDNGFHPVVALDACGTFSHHKRQAGLARLATLGIEVSDYATMMVEVMADNADPQAERRLRRPRHALRHPDRPGGRPPDPMTATDVAIHLTWSSSAADRREPYSPIVSAGMQNDVSCC